MFRSKLQRGLTRAIAAYALAYLVAMQGLFAAFASEQVDTSHGTVICSQTVEQKSSKERHPAHASCCVLMSCCLGLQATGASPESAPAPLRAFDVRTPSRSANAALMPRAAKLHFSARAPPAAV